MRMSDARMYARVLNGDASFDGRFFTGVLTTGIYCLPSCKARKPKPENVRFFPSCEAARATGLRACKKCRPDDFARGADPVLETIETVVAEIRADPAAFADARAVVRRSGFGATRVFELFRRHYHATPADLLLRARLAAAKTYLLSGDAGLARIAADVGFESLSVFHDQFRRLNALTPADYRALAATASFELSLPPDYPLAHLRRALTRDTQSVNERLDGARYLGAVRLNDGTAALLTLDLARAPGRVAVELLPYGPDDPPAVASSPTTHRTADRAALAHPSTPSTTQTPRAAARLGARAHALVVGLLGLDQDSAAFSRLAKRLGFARLVSGRENLRIAQTPSVFDGVLWAIIGQQINLAFASTLRRRLIERIGTPLDHGLIAPPTPAAVAALAPDDLLALRFSRQKADYLIATARLVARRELDLAALPAMSATRAERALSAVRGLGPWSVNYLMMRSLGFADCVPLGDTGVTSGLNTLLALEERPDVDATRRLMAVFSPFRSLASAHLWQLPQPPPS